MAEAVKTSATEFKQHVGRYLDVARTKRVVIERHGRPTAVLIPVEEYEALNPAASRTLDMLTDEFDALVLRMQRPGFRRALERAFAASPQDMGGAQGRRMKRGGGR
jgi:prevent-host-death family protein